MKNIMHLLIGVLCFPLVLRAQPSALVRAEMEKVAAAYNTGNGVFFDVTTLVFDAGEKDPNPSYTVHYTYATSGREYYMKINKVERIGNQHVTLVIDHEMKMVMVNKPEIGTTEFSSYYKKLHNEGLKMCSNIDELPEQNGQKGFVFHYKDMPYKSIRLLYNATTFFIELYEISYASGEKVQMFYSDFKPVDAQNNPFNEQNVIRNLPAGKRKKNAQPLALTDHYRNYRMVNNFN